MNAHRSASANAGAMRSRAEGPRPNRSATARHSATTAAISRTARSARGSGTRNQGATADLTAPAASFAFLFAGQTQSPPQPLVFGTLWVQLAPHVVVLPFPSVVGGRGTISISLPSVRPGTAASLQSATLGSTTLELSSPVILTLDG